ncbi:MAG: glutamate-5-semialdehyde dehydrogenase [Muribaculaceae bacterium]|nr:glutamate-5-semialdehyde dehydrogenase [Muribaculaceae bacterium]
MKQTVALIRKAKEASRSLLGIAPDRVAQVLAKTASRIVENADFIIAENRKDLLRMDEGNPDYDRLRLSPERVADIASDMLAVSRLPEPYGRVLSETVRPNGMRIAKVSVPFGVIGVIYEARPNVTADVFGLCFRAGSACVLKGGHDADLSSRAIVSVIHACLREEGLPEDLCVLLPGERESAAVMMEAVGLIDVIIPRGGRGLIDYVRTHSVVPVIETGAGVCHTYIDASASLEKSVAVVCNAKTRRVSVCNALDCLLIHRDRLADLPSIAAPLKERNVVIYADCEAFDALRDTYPHLLLEQASAESYGTEFRDYKMAVRTVGSLDEALEHISAFGSHHSECIMSEDMDAVRRFQTEVDAACVYANVSTAFTDGGQFGFGAEIGISTQKLHARGPMALPELCTYKYIISGDGQIR